MFVVVAGLGAHQPVGVGAAVDVAVVVGDAVVAASEPAGGDAVAGAESSVFVVSGHYPEALKHSA